ncbi:hypothetical protein FQA39_LY16995 [Lamprigera yunnana]|nr:hypothetical protein FQA39_LY16995 [Lamprigera yunnana]
MKYIIVFLTCITFATAFHIRPRVVNGTDADIRDYPYVVSLRFLVIHFCGASILNERYILTAAHCFLSFNSDLSVQFGLTDIDLSYEQSIEVAVVRAHKDFKPVVPGPNDIAVLKLKSAIPFGQYAQPVVLPLQNEVAPVGARSVLVGWGATVDEGTSSTTLQMVQLKLYSHEACLAAHPSVVYKYNLCSGVDEGWKGQCGGDSGGPLTAGGKQIGVVSWSVKPCGAKGYPGVYTRVASYINWIEWQMLFYKSQDFFSKLVLVELTLMHEKLFCIPEVALQELLCGHCGRFLSSGPICVLPDGRSVCGRCVKKNRCRVFALEAILKKCCFPCNFYQNGCKKLLEFNKALLHEAICIYRLFTCPLLQYAECKWKGPTGQFIEHCLNTHCKYISENLVFKLDVDQNSEDMIMYTKDKVAYIAKYNYESSKQLLKYDVRHCTSQNVYAHFKMQILNSRDQDCSVNLKSQICHKYDEHFTSFENNYLLDLNKYLRILENPSSIVVALSTYQEKIAQEYTETKDVDVLNTLKCEECCNYLVPPIYDFDGYILCSDCGEAYPDCKLSNNDKLKVLIANVEYPCRWRQCNSVVKSDQFRNHELQCEYRNYDCLFPTCNVTFKLDSSIEHLMKVHQATYLPNAITYNIKFQENYRFKYLFTIKEKFIIMIEDFLITGEDDLVHRMKLFSTSSKYTRANVEFEHNHCKLRPKLFLLVTDHHTDINFNEMPFCFKYDEHLLVTISILEDKAVPKLKDVAGLA